MSTSLGVNKYEQAPFIQPHSAPIAQLVEQLPLKETVPGPSPGGRTIWLAFIPKHFLAQESYR